MGEETTYIIVGDEADTETFCEERFGAVDPPNVRRVWRIDKLQEATLDLGQPRIVILLPGWTRTAAGSEMLVHVLQASEGMGR